MMVMQLGGQEFLSKYPKDNAIFQGLTAFYGRHGSLPIIAEKNIIALFRKCMIYDNAVEDIQPVQISRSSIKAVIEERKSDKKSVIFIKFVLQEGAFKSVMKLFARKI